MSTIINGYTPLGKSGEDGIRYTWNIGKRFHLVESAAFNKRTIIRTNLEDENISAYTTSVSAGCVLKTAGMECRFCRTGRLLPFGRFLTSLEIAIQNVFMVLADIECLDHDNIRSNMREFAYMGQGEPGYSYPQVRSAIRLTNYVMSNLGQSVYRHIIATCGIAEMIESLCYDVKSGFFEDTRVTLHFSLHASVNREHIMPIENLYPHHKIIPRLTSFYDNTGEKPCVGILLLKNFKSRNESIQFTHGEDTLSTIASLLSPSYHRVSLCEYNESEDIGTNESVSLEEAETYRSLFVSKGFEAKLFASFGRKENTACGLLGGVEALHTPGEGSNRRYRETVDMVEEAARMLGDVIK